MREEENLFIYIHEYYLPLLEIRVLHVLNLGWNHPYSNLTYYVHSVAAVVMKMLQLQPMLKLSLMMRMRNWKRLVVLE